MFIRPVIRLLLSFAFFTPLILSQEALAGVDRPAEMREAIALAEGHMRKALQHPEAIGNPALKEKLQTLLDTFLETDIYVDHENTGSFEACSNQVGRVAYTTRTTFLGGPTLDLEINFCARILERNVAYQAQFVVHESIHAAELDGSEIYGNEKFPNLMEKRECVAENFTFKVLELAGVLPYPTKYSLQNLGGPGRYMGYCEQVTPGLVEKAFDAMVIHVFSAIRNQALPLSQVDKDLIHNVKHTPNLRNEKDPRLPTVLYEAVSHARPDWVKFLKERTMVDIRQTNNVGVSIFGAALRRGNQEVYELLTNPENWANDFNGRLVLEFNTQVARNGPR